jgi:hypothetical protein
MKQWTVQSGIWHGSCAYCINPVEALYVVWISTDWFTRFLFIWEHCQQITFLYITRTGRCIVTIDCAYISQYSTVRRSKLRIAYVQQRFFVNVLVRLTVSKMKYKHEKIPLNIFRSTKREIMVRENEGSSALDLGQRQRENCLVDIFTVL